MTQENVVFCNSVEEDDDLDINFEKYWKAIWSRKTLLIKIFCLVLVFFMLLTFILPKKYTVTADLYVNKSNNSNMLEVNPYVIDEASTPTLSMGIDKTINNEMELMKSELVLDKVIRENNIRYIKGKKKGEYLIAEDFYRKGKVLKIDNVKNTNVITLKYKHKDPELAYGVLSSLITNYIELHKELNTEKAKSDKKIIESEYLKTKEILNKKVSQASGLPSHMTSIGNLPAMSAYSKTASSAMSNLKSQYIAGEKSQIAITEENKKLAELAAKFEWAKLVEQMSDSSKVLVLKEPKLLRPFENSSPKLLINIILGCVFGYLTALSTLIYKEVCSKNLTYSMLTNNIIFDGIEKQNLVETKCYSFSPKKVLCLSFVQLPNSLTSRLQNISNVNVAYYNETKDFIDKISAADKIVLFSKIGITNADSYKIVREVVKNQQKEIVYDVLI